VKYDTIIIGAGLSGLAAGIRLAYYEKSVCIVERHNRIGGLNSFYRLRGREHDVGLHAVTNWAPLGVRSAPINRLMRQLRLRPEDFELAPQIESAIVFPECTLRFGNDFSLLEAEVAEHFPAEIDRFRNLVREIDQFDAFRLGPRPSSAREVLAERLKDPLLVEMLLCPIFFYGSPTPDDIDFLDFVILFRSIFREGFGRPRAGIRPILNRLTRQFRDHGGELKLNCGVQRIIHDGHRVNGVILDDGRLLEADNVLSSAGLVETLDLCQAPPEIRQQHPAGELSFIELICCLDIEPARLGIDRTIVFFNTSERIPYHCPEGPAELGCGVICCPNNFHYDQPLDDGRVRITVLANPEYWLDLPVDRYASEKETWRPRIVDAACRIVPDFRDHIVDTDLFTPRTIHRYTGHVNGAVYGAPRKIRDGRTYLEGLYLCGTDQGYLGIVGSMLSGITVANLYLLK